jgi:polyribonucleotide nucleotidyltransferase
VIEVEVPKECVGMVIGRGGVVIKEIQEKSNTRITFKDGNPDDEIRICRIRGSSESAQLAETMIHDLIINQPVIHSLVLNVPQVSIVVVRVIIIKKKKKPSFIYITTVCQEYHNPQRHTVTICHRNTAQHHSTLSPPQPTYLYSTKDSTS